MSVRSRTGVLGKGTPRVPPAGGASLPLGECDGQMVFWDADAEAYALTACPADGQVYRFDAATGLMVPVTLPDSLWYGRVYGAYGNCDPELAIRMATHVGSIAATPTNITTTAARVCYFRPPAAITVNRIRFFGVGNVVNTYRVAIYNADTLARLTAELIFSTSNQAWGSAGSALGLTLTSGQLYFIAVGVDATGATAGCLCMSASNAFTTGQLGVLPKDWPGNLDIDLGFVSGGFAQFATVAGALPDPAPTIVAQPTWTGGFPLFLLDANDAA